MWWFSCFKLKTSQFDYTEFKKSKNQLQSISFYNAEILLLFDIFSPSLISRTVSVDVKHHVYYIFSCCNTSIIKNVPTFSFLCVCLGVNTHITETSFSAFVSVEELAQAYFYWSIIYFIFIILYVNCFDIIFRLICTMWALRGLMSTW